MKLITMTSIAAAALAATISTSLAADVSAPIAPSFEGFYVGGFGGYAGARFDGVVDSSEIRDDTAYGAEIFDDSWTGAGAFGAYLGYNFQGDTFVYGVELDAGMAGLDAKAIDDGGNDYATNELDWFGSARVRLGMTVGDSTLLYATGGLGYISTTFTAYNDMDDIDAEVGDTNIGAFTGVAGAGVEHMLSENVGLRVEGLYYFPTSEHEFDEDELTSDMDDGDYAKVNGFYQIRGGISFRF